MERQRKSAKLIREGQYLAEVSVTLIEDETAWSPYLSPVEAAKLDAVRRALDKRDVETAKQYGRVFELLPISA